MERVMLHDGIMTDYARKSSKTPDVRFLSREDIVIAVRENTTPLDIWLLLALQIYTRVEKLKKKGAWKHSPYWVTQYLRNQGLTEMTPICSFIPNNFIALSAVFGLIVRAMQSVWYIVAIHGFRSWEFVFHDSWVISENIVDDVKRHRKRHSTDIFYYIAVVS